LIEQLRKNEQADKEEIVRLISELSASKNALNEYSTSCESTKSELKFSRAEIARLKKVQEDLKMSNINKEEIANELKIINEELASRCRGAEDLAKKYSMLNERSRESLGCSLE
jgi:archaellum component FlaC